MKVLIPILNQTDVYHDNLFRAPSFAIYSIENRSKNVYCSLTETIQNPFSCLYEKDMTTCDNYGICDQKSCSMQHKEDHFNLIKSMTHCDVILADHFCDTITTAIKEGGIKLYKLSPFLKKPDVAIKNFILGASLASTLQHIHIKS